MLALKKSRAGVHVLVRQAHTFLTALMLLQGMVSRLSKTLLLLLIDTGNS